MVKVVVNQLRVLAHVRLQHINRHIPRFRVFLYVVVALKFLGPLEFFCVSQ